jgi:glycerophosphoryl diester phosphodiesterase
MIKHMQGRMAAVVLLAGMAGAAFGAPDQAGFGAGKGSQQTQLGPRPFYLVADMDEGRLKDRLASCAKGPFASSKFSIGHRGAALQFPEHTRESYEAAARMGAGIIECDVTFTKDRELVCRHSQCDLHTTTDILATPLAAKCSQDFVPAVLDPVTGEVLEPARANCCTSDITLAEFRTLQGKMDGANPAATTVEEYLAGTPNWRTDLYSARGTLMTHAESIALIDDLGADFTPELKAPGVPMPFDSDGDGVGDYSQEDYAQQLIDEYRAAGIPPRRVWPQSFQRGDVQYWIAHEPVFGRQAVFLDDADSPADLPAAAELGDYAAAGIRIVAPPLWALLALDGDGHMVPSQYALDARAAGLDIITWTLERSWPLTTGGGWYYQTVTDAIDNDGDIFTALDVLAREVGVLGVFSDWPATVTYYANCMKLR